MAAQNYYSTTFPLTENPISEGGNWLNGAQAGVTAATNMQTFADGHISGTTVQVGCSGSNPNACNDGVAELTGTWSSDQAACATIFITGSPNRQTGTNEVEIKLHQSLTGGVSHGYEFNMSLGTNPGIYMQIVRIDGGSNPPFQVLGGGNGVVAVNNGDIFCASSIAGNLKSWVFRPSTGTIVNSAPASPITDTTYTGGSPGLGIFNAGVASDFALFGFSQFQATNLAARTANQTDVAAVINGPLKVIADGESVTIPPSPTAGAVTWTSGITFPAGVGIQLFGYGQPSNDPTQFTASPTCSATALSLNTNRASALSATPLATSGTLRLSCMSISLAAGSNGGFGLSSLGACTTSTCSQLRMDNLTWNNWCGNNNVFGINQIGDMFGIVDHNTINGCAAGGANSFSQLVEISHASYLDPSKFWGDNSWALPENYGSANFLFFENNTFIGAGCCENEQRVGAFQNQGGSRAVARFNKFSKTDGSNFSLGWHGSESSGRPRGGRAFEFYENVLTYGATCNGQGTNCPPAIAARSGTGIAWGNTMNSATVNLSKIGGVFGLNNNRVTGPINWGSCDGTQAQDGNDPAGVQFTGTVATWTVNGASGVMTFTTPPSPPWTVNQWVPYGAPYSMHDVTQSVAGSSAGQEILSNDASTLTLRYGGATFTVAPVPGDTVQITRAFWCMDQGGGRGAGIYQSPHGLNAVPPYGFAFSNEVLSPTYFFMNSYPASLPSSAEVQANYGKIIPNRDWYNEGLNQAAQTSATFPFNGLSDSQPISSYVCSASSCTVTVPSTASFQVNGPFQVVNTIRNSSGVSADNSGAITSLTGTTVTYPNHEGFANSAGAGGFLITVGAGHGTFARRPTTCTAGHSYWATDQANWNSTAPANQSGNLYICGASGWPALPTYVPFSYPHPLINAVITPTVSLSPSSEDCGSVNVGSSANCGVVTLTNTSGGSITISSITYSGVNFADFSTASTTCTGAIANGGSCTVTPKFTPSFAGVEGACLLNVAYTGFTGSPVKTSLTGTGVGSPTASITPSGLTFTSQQVGTSSASQALTLHNTGTAPLTINSISLTGANPGDYSQTNTCGGSLGVGSTCTINVTFSPTATGVRTANVSVSDNASGSPHTASLTGTGIASAIQIFPAAFNFGSQIINTSSGIQIIYVSNTSGVAVTVTSIVLTGANPGDFSLPGNNNCGGSIPNNGVCQIDVVFTPTVVGSRTANITLTDNAAGSPQQVPLTGTGIPIPAPQPVASGTVGVF